jgi:hypothetical protein
MEFHCTASRRNFEGVQRLLLEFLQIQSVLVVSVAPRKSSEQICSNINGNEKLSQLGDESGS